VALADPQSTPQEEPAADELGKMTLFEHLAELRIRLIISIVAVVIGTVVVWFFYGDLLSFMTHPYREFALHHPQKGIPGSGQLVAMGPLEGFTTRLKVSAYGGIAVASPVVFWELWRFITPGLYKNEKRYLVPFVAAAVVLFAAGVATAVLVFPKALTWLIDVSGPSVVPFFSPSKYLTLYVSMCVIFGLVFTYPLVVVFLELVEVVPSRTWRKWRRPAIVVIALVAAIITPSSDPFSFIAMAVPMLVFYEGAIIVGRVLRK
jgi:sec-independent protein translocase protein TatC